MNYWLMKSEPSTFSIDDLRACAQGEDHWEGIRNYQVRNFLRDDFRKGDEAFFYHSNCKVPGIVGTLTVISEGYVDDTAFDPTSDYYDEKSTSHKPRWYRVDVKFKKKFKEIIPLQTLRAIPELEKMTLLKKGNRLSITPITPKEWKVIHELSEMP